MCLKVRCRGAAQLRNVQPGQHFRTSAAAFGLLAIATSRLLGAYLPSPLATLPVSNQFRMASAAPGGTGSCRHFCSAFLRLCSSACTFQCSIAADRSSRASWATARFRQRLHGGNRDPRSINR